MKKIFIAILMVSMLVSSCSILDINPKSSWSASTVPTEKAHLEGILNGGFERMCGALQSNFIVYGDARADVYYVNSPTATNYDRIVRSQIDGNLSQSSWSSLYQVVKQANILIEHTPKLLSEGKITQLQANNYLGQGYCMRGFAYFYIVRNWGEAPIITKALASATDRQDVARSSIDDVFALIHQDFQKAIDLLPTPTSTTISRIKFTPLAASGYKAHAYMWQHKYSEALALLEAAMPTSNSSMYRLAALADNTRTPSEGSEFRGFIDGTEFSQMFNGSTGKTSPESIFELGFSEADNDVNNTFDSFFTSSTSTFKVREDFSDNLVRNNGFTLDDFRYYASISAVVSGKQNVRKMVVGYTKGAVRNIIMLRLADLKLLRAEARILLANDDPTDQERKDIMADINDIRKRAYGPTSQFGEIPAGDGTTDGYLNREQYMKEDFIHLLKAERRKELAFEGHRYYDLVRWGDLITALGKMVPSQKATYTFSNGPVVMTSDKNIVWPISIEEIRRSKYIEQNEYYK